MRSIELACERIREYNRPVFEETAEEARVSRCQADSAQMCGGNGEHVSLHALWMKGSFTWPMWRYINTRIYDELTKCQVVRGRKTRFLGVQL